MRLNVWKAALVGLGISGMPAASAAVPERLVEVVQTPDGGIQPQAVIDAKGTVHLVYFKGEPAAGDLFYTRRERGARSFAPPLRVNSQPGSAVAIGTVRGGQLALGRGGRVHVAWNGSGKALPKNADGSSPMLYTRSDREGRAFEPQRDLMTKTTALDGGGTVAADDAGHVYVAWHGRGDDSIPGEAGRRMWVARSDDDGAEFAPEASAFDKETGACGCCGTRALADPRGTLYLLYRSATNFVGRDMYLLTAREAGARFRGNVLAPWKVSVCPMSTESLANAPTGVLAAWETDRRVSFVRIDPESGQPSSPVTPPGRGDRKHPAVAGNAQGETLLAWAEGTGWQKGGALVWQLFDRSGRPMAEKGRIEDGIPIWGLPTVVAKPDGNFLIIH